MSATSGPSREVGAFEAKAHLSRLLREVINALLVAERRAVIDHERGRGFLQRLQAWPIQRLPG